MEAPGEINEKHLDTDLHTKAFNTGTNVQALTHVDKKGFSCYDCAENPIVLSRMKSLVLCSDCCQIEDLKMSLLRKTLEDYKDEVTIRPFDVLKLERSVILMSFGAVAFPFLIKKQNRTVKFDFKYAL
ncbi:hypothetical protein HNY73_019168 [Argiope bruennichi]|uniref:Uncharacterized protein n=1 Tax=Argiope bruennichi TaxID=94029 RepID=A0A8T0EJI0_ARGBR|nr:hypothetical protein HNY73_019168 [Argiope bruennichi]